MVRNLTFLSILFFSLFSKSKAQDSQVGKWQKFEKQFNSRKTYENPLYEVQQFEVTFTSPAGRTHSVNGFWDGGTTWKVRFAPDQTGRWSYRSSCSDQKNTGLHGITGSFECVPNENEFEIYSRGPLKQPLGTYHLAYDDGTPFFWTACTAWNGALKSTEAEWDKYLQHRKDHHYNVIQFVTTQWRGADQNSQGEVAFTGSGRIEINPEFFQHLDQKVDRINEYGLVAAPVLLWALPVGAGRELSPGYYLPDNEAIMLAKYIIARYQGNQVVWVLGGDGRYLDELEDRWKYIGREVFKNDPPGLVTHHPMGRHWIGKAYGQEPWMDIVGYQSSHGNTEGTVNWINYEPIASDWKLLPAKPIINLEPNYEEIYQRITAEDVRNASYWSVFATPPGGITYGANGIWPWIREGEKILNHGGDYHVSTWEQSIDFPGSLQIGYLHQFIKQHDWWDLRPSPELLVAQPGDENFDQFISVVKTPRNDLIMAYVPVKTMLEIYKPGDGDYVAEWFDPVRNTMVNGKVTEQKGILRVESPGNQDYVLVLKQESK